MCISWDECSDESWGSPRELRLLISVAEQWLMRGTVSSKRLLIDLGGLSELLSLTVPLRHQPHVDHLAPFA